MAANLSFLNVAVDDQKASNGLVGTPIMPSVDVKSFSRVSLEIYNAEVGGDAIDRIVLFGSISGSYWGKVYDSNDVYPVASGGLGWANGPYGAGSGAFLATFDVCQYSFLYAEAICASGLATIVDTTLAEWR